MTKVMNIGLLMVSLLLGLLAQAAVEAAPPPLKGGGKHPPRPPAAAPAAAPAAPGEDEQAMVRLMLDLKHLAMSKPIRPVNSDSISPWTYTFSHDENRFPTDIAEAKCSLKGCRLSAHGDETLDLESKPIYKQILVLRRVQGSGTDYHLRLEYNTIAVGCTCVRPSVHQQQ